MLRFFDAEYAIILLKKQTASHKPQPRTPNHVKVKKMNFIIFFVEI